MANINKKYNANLNRDLFALSLDPTAQTSLQVQLLNALRGIITSSSIYAGLRVPASRVLAEELSVSRTTVQSVYDQLISEGYLVGRRGSGTYVATDITHLSSPRTRRKPARQPVDAWLPFQTGLPDQSLLPHKLWAQHLERSWRSPNEDLLGRADPLGWYPLREAICDHLLAWRNLSCDPEQVVITSGAWESFELIFRGIFSRGKRVAVEDPCWPKTRDILATAEAETYSLKIDDLGFDASKIPEKTHAAIVTPSRHFPTGISLPLARRIALLEWAAKSGGMVVEDDYDSEFRYRGQPLPSLSGLDGLRHTIYLGSFSKLISSSLRLGYLVLPKHLLNQSRRYLDRVGQRASLVPQPALAAFMQGGEFAVHLRRMRRVYARRQKHLIAALNPVSDMLDLQTDLSGMHLCAPLRTRLLNRVSDREISRCAGEIGLSIGTLSEHSVLPDKPQALLLGYAAFDEKVLTEASAQLVGLLRRVG